MSIEAGRWLTNRMVLSAQCSRRERRLAASVVALVCSCLVDEVSELDFVDDEDPQAPNVRTRAAEAIIAAAVFFILDSNQLGVIRRWCPF